MAILATMLDLGREQAGKLIQEPPPSGRSSHSMQPNDHWPSQLASTVWRYGSSPYLWIKSLPKVGIFDWGMITMFGIFLASTAMTDGSLAPLVIAFATPTGPEGKARDTTLSKPVDKIVVKARAQARESRIDRDVYDVRVLPNAPATVAVDVIGHIPGILVDPSNRIAMVGGAVVTILVDGKAMSPTAAFQIPANQIARIEVMSTPPTDYAFGTQAVINIITHKTKAKDNVSGTVAASIDTLDSRAITLSYNRDRKPWSINSYFRVAASEVPFRRRSDGISGSEAYREEQIEIGQGQVGPSDINTFLRAVRTFSSTSSLTLSSNYYAGDMNFQADEVETRTQANSQVITPILTTESSPVSVNSHSLSFQSEKVGKHKFNFAVSWDNMISKFTSIRERPTQTLINRQRSEANTLGFETSYEKTFIAGRVLTLGIKYNDETLDFNFADFGYAGPDLSQISLFQAQKLNQAAFATLRFKLGKFGFQQGVRLETTEINWSNEDDFLSGKTLYQRVLSNLSLTRSLGAFGTVKASYSQGTTPSSLVDLNPFRRKFGLYYAKEGNPDLEPADRRTFEVTHEYVRDNISLVTTAFYRDTKNEIDSGARLIEDYVVIAAPVNLTRYQATGLGATLRGKIGKNLNYSINGEVSEIAFSDPFLVSGKSVVRERQSNGKASIDYKPTATDEFLISTSFQSDTYRLGYVQKGAWTNSLQYTRQLPNKVSLVFTATNFGVQTDRIYQSIGPGFSTLYRSTNTSRALKIALSKMF